MMILRVTWGPEILLSRISTLGQRRRFTAWAPLVAQVLPVKTIDGPPVGAALFSC
jgi:hypothetical protein